MKNIINRVTRCKMQQFMVISWLLVGYSFNLCCSMQIFKRYPIKEDTDLDKNAGILFERCYFLLHL